MNEELLPASVLFVKSGALLISNNGYITFFQLSNIKPTQVCSTPADRQVISTITGGTSKGIITSILPLKMPKDY
jgi:hypothetical protein